MSGDAVLIGVGERQYRLLSASDKFRAGVAIQFATVRCDGSEAIVTDNDLDMDTVYHEGVIRTVIACGLPTLISIKVEKRAPNFSQAPPSVADRGRSYRLENGTAYSIS
ncbi:MAG: hypothetical protein WD470_09425 [Rhodospirillaceae bacterium]